MDTWNPVEGFVIGGGAAVRASVREVIRAHRVLAMTAEDDAGSMIVRLAVTDAGHVAVVGAAGDVQAGVPLAELRAEMAATVPDALVLVNDVANQSVTVESPLDGLGDDVPVAEDGPDGPAGAPASSGAPGSSGAPASSGATGPLDDAWWTAARDLDEAPELAGADLTPADLTAPTVVHTDTSAAELVVEAGYQGVPFALLHHGRHVLVLCDQPVQIPGTLGRSGTSTILTALPDGVAVEVISPRRAVTWAVGDARLESVALPGADVHAGALAEFLERRVGAGAIARIVAEEVPGSDPAALRTALSAPASEQTELLVAALGLPDSVARVLRGTLAPSRVEGAHLVAPTGVSQAMVDAMAIELTGPEGERGWRKFYRTVAVDRPWILRAASAAEAAAGLALTGLSVRKARAGNGTSGNATRGVVGALLVLDAAGELVLQRALRRRIP